MTSVLVVGIVATPAAKRRCPQQPVPAARALTPSLPLNSNARLTPHIVWRGSSAELSWQSEVPYAAGLQATPASDAAASSVLQAQEASRGVEHSVTLRGLLPGTAYRVRASSEGQVLFEQAGRTLEPAAVARGLIQALERFAPWSVLGQLRKDWRLAAVRDRGKREALEKALRERWNVELGRRVRDSGFEESSGDFDAMSDGYFGSLAVPLAEKLGLYRHVQEQREMEIYCQTHDVRLPIMSSRILSVSYGLSLEARLKRPRAVTLQWPSAPTGMCAGMQAPEQLGELHQVDDPGGCHFVLTCETRRERFRPGRACAGAVLAMEHWASEPRFNLPLPDGRKVAAAELEAVVQGLEPKNAFRVFLKPPGQDWIAIADLRPPGGGLYRLYHGLDPRLLVPSSRVRVELVYFEDVSSLEERACLGALSFRWTERP